MFYQNPTAPSHVCTESESPQTLRLPMLTFDGFTSLSCLPPALDLYTCSITTAFLPGVSVALGQSTYLLAYLHSLKASLLHIGHRNTLLDCFALFAFHRFWQCREVNRNQSPLSSHSDAGSPLILSPRPSISTH